MVKEEGVEAVITFQNMLKFFNKGFFILRKGRIFAFNVEGAAILKKKKEDIFRKNFSNFIMGEDREFFEENLINVTTNNNLPLVFDIRLISGATVEIFMYDFFEEELIFVALEEIRDGNAIIFEISKLYTIFNQSQDSVVVTNVRGEIEYVNKKFLELTGYEKNDLIGKTTKILNSGNQSSLFYKNMWETIERGDIWRGELQNKKKSGELYWETSTVSPIRAFHKNIGYFAVKKDITEKKEIQTELIKRNKEYEKTINQLRMTQTKLIHQEQMAGIGQLAAGIAHEINNPLAFITSNIRTLRDYISDYQAIIRRGMGILGIESYDERIVAKENFEKYVEEMDLEFLNEDIPNLISETEEGLARILEIVRGLRAFSRVDHLDENETYDLNEGIKNSLIVAKNEIKYVAEVETELGNLPVIQAKGSQINQVLLNVLINAVHAIEERNLEGLGKIVVKTYVSGKDVFCRISDNGGGIDPGSMKKIFNPFFTTKAVGKGTGLGLGISYDIIVEKHKGDIWAESEIGKGTSFWIKLPISSKK